MTLRQRLLGKYLWPLWIFAVMRFALSASGAIIWWGGLIPEKASQALWTQPEVSSLTEGPYGALVGVWSRFDADYYTAIALHGYFNEQVSIFWPLYPAMIRLVAPLLGNNMLAGAFFVANVACALLFVCLYRLVLEEGLSETTARASVLYLAFFPMSFILFAPYSESVFILLCVLTLHEARRERWWLAGLWAFLASLTRLQGVLLGLVILVEMLGRTCWQLRRLKWQLVAPTLPMMGLGAFLLWRTLAGFPSFIDIQYKYWGNLPAWPHEAILQTVIRIFNGVALPVEYVNLGITLAMLWLGVWVVKTLPLSYAIYFWAAFIFTLCRIHIAAGLTSEARYCLMLFPAFMVLAQKITSPWGQKLLHVASLSLCFMHASLFVMGGFVG